jgi:hypothetical protein
MDDVLLVIGVMITFLILYLCLFSDLIRNLFK